MYGYNIKKGKYINFHLVSLNPFIIGKQEQSGSSFSHDPDELSELYYFDSSLVNLREIMKHYEYSKDTSLLDTFLNRYRAIKGNTEYYVYSIDYLNKDFTVYIKFSSIKYFGVFLKESSSDINGNISLLLQVLKEYFTLKHYVYFKVKYTKSGETYYSIVVGFNNSNTQQIFEKVCDSLTDKIQGAELQELQNIQKNNASRIEFSFNLTTGDIENIYFSNIQDDI